MTADYRKRPGDDVVEPLFAALAEEPRPGVWGLGRLVLALASLSAAAALAWWIVPI